MCEVVELTYSQIENRLKFLSGVAKAYEDYYLCINVSNKYNPVPILCKNAFLFPEEEHHTLCYTTPRPFEFCEKDSMDLELSDLKDLDTVIKEQKAIIVDNTKTYSICGVYVDKKNKIITLLNGYYDGQPVDWSVLKGDIY